MYSLIHLLLLYFFVLSGKMYFTIKIFDLHIISLGLTCTRLYVNVCRDIITAQSNIYDGASLRISQQRFIVEAPMGSK